MAVTQAGEAKRMAGTCSRCDLRLVEVEAPYNLLTGCRQCTSWSTTRESTM